jgi:MoaA/NifB/PqqE/SkfB family radical SAM enzyme
MFKFNQLHQVQLEITSRCQASCPMCPRNIHGGLENPTLGINDWSLEDFTKIFSNDILSQVELISFCGNFGDAMLNNDLIAMCKYVTNTAPNVRIQIHTNGSARTAKWWTELAQSLPKKHSVVFALDGLADTQHLYRVGTDFNKIIDNAKTFMAAGGIAEWAYIRFKHNSHQVEQARELSKQLGFSNFILKDSRRFSRPFPVVDRQGEFLYNLEQPEDTPIVFVGKDQVEGHQNWPDADKIHCQVLEEKSIYIDANYLVSPCCMVGAFMYSNYDREILKQYNLDEEDSVLDEATRVQQQVLAFPKLNALETGLKNIIESDHWQTIWQKRWEEKTSSPCIIMCGPHSPFVSIADQVKK